MVFTSEPPTRVDEGAPYRYILRAVDLAGGDDGGGGGDDGGGDGGGDDGGDSDGDDDGDDDGGGRGRGDDDGGGGRGRGDDDGGGGRGRGNDDDKHLAITYQAPLLPSWLSFDGVDTISGTPGAEDVGAHSVRVTASSSSDTDVQNFQILVTVANLEPPRPELGHADLVAGIAVAPNPVGVGASAVWTFSVENRSGVDVANVALRAELVSDVPLALDTPSHGGCSLQPAGNQTAIDCRLGPLSRNASETVRVAVSGSQAGDVRGTASVSISDPIPVDSAADNNVARATLSISERISGGPVQLLSVNEARASVAGDFDDDGMIDLAVVAGANVLLFKGIADPANPSKRLMSTMPVNLAQSAAANAITATDLDGDSDLDLVTANGAGASDMILLNSGDAHFTASPLDNSVDASRAVAVGDLDGDALADIVFANAQSSAVYRNSGAGAFALAATISNNARDVVIANVLGDASPELVFANANADATVYRRSGTAFELAATIATGSAVSVAAADFDNDGDLDLVFARGGAASSQVYRNQSSGSPVFVLSDELVAAGTIDVLSADFDSDGDIDVVTINGAGGHQLHLNDGASSATFTPHPERFVLAGARSSALGKISVDDRDDVIVTGSVGVGIFFNDGHGNFGAGDMAAPTLTLNGTPNVELQVGLAYQDPGATAADAIDGDLSGKIVVDNPVDPAVIGSYTVVYKVVDSSGNAATPVTRSVQVRAQTGTGGGGGGALNLELLLLTLFTLLRLRRGVALRAPPSS